jgi:hypothetical protein
MSIANFAIQELGMPYLKESAHSVSFSTISSNSSAAVASRVKAYKLVRSALTEGVFVFVVFYYAGHEEVLVKVGAIERFHGP